MDDHEEPKWTEYLWFDDVSSSEWISISSAIDQLSAWESEPQAKAVDYLQSGLWSASFRRARILGGLVPMSPRGGFSTQLNAVGRGWGRGNIDETLGSGRTTRKFWHNAHKNAGKAWSFDTGFIYPDGARIELSRGEIEAFHGEFVEDAKDHEFLAFRFTAYGVAILKSDVDATAPKMPFNDIRTVRQTAFDWESAFADVAAELYHDLQFENIDARGVPAKLVEALRRSFEKRKLQVPEISSLKAKARILAGALRSKG